VQWRELVLQLKRGGKITFQACGLEFGAEPGRNVRRDRNAAMAAMGHEAERSDVLAGQLIEIFTERRTLLRHAGHVRGRVLHPGDVLKFVQTLHCIDRHVDHRSHGNVVDDDRNANRVVDRLVVLVKAFLCGFVVIGGYDKHRIGAGAFGVAGQFDRLGGRVGARARYDRDPAAGLVDTPFHNLVVFPVGQRWAFPGRTDRNQAAGALGDLPINQVAEALFVHGPVLERGHERSK